jgi:L-arabinose isomerase
MKNKDRKSKAGLLLLASPRFKDLGKGLSRGTYGERKAREVDSIIHTNYLSTFLDMVYPGIIYERENVEKAISLFVREKVDFIIAEFLSWSEDFAWIRFLRDMPDIPILFVNPVKKRMSFETTLDEDDFIDYLCAGTLVGSLEASGSVARTERKNLKIAIGSREELSGQIRDFATVSRVKKILSQSSVGLLANYNEAMWSTYIDPYNLFTRLGPEIRFISYSTYADVIENIDEREFKMYKDYLLSKYKIMDDVEIEKFDASVYASIGLAKLAEQYDIDALIFNDIDPAMFKLIGLRAGFYHPYFNENHSILVPEADIGAGLITYILKLISGKHVNFIEPFHIESDFGTFAGGHAGPNDHNDPNYTQNVIIARDVRFAKTNYKYAGAPFAWYRISPGRKTMAQLVEENKKYKLVTTLVDSLEGEHLLATYSHSIFKPVVPVNDLFKQILKIGTTQHFAIVDGDYLRQLSLFAEIMGFEYYEII